MLRDVADLDTAIAGHPSLAGILLSHQHPEKGGLAATVGADDSDACPLIDIQVDARKDDIGAVMDGQVRGGNQRHEVGGTPEESYYRIGP